MTAPYYEDDLVQLWHGNCLEEINWLQADVLITDPPYGRNWRQGALERSGSDSHPGIAGDATTAVRDSALAAWGDVPAIVFGDLMLPPPLGTKQVLVYRKPPDAGNRGAMAGYRRDLEAIYLTGDWPTGIGGRTSLIATKEPAVGNPSSPAGRFKHPHAKPIDVMCALARHTTGTIADPFAGSGSTLVAAKLLGRKAIGVEIDEAHAEMAAKRLAHDVLDFGEWDA